jgi:hypothetical protein
MRKKQIKNRKRKKINKPRPLGTVYNGIDVIGFTLADYQMEKALYDQLKAESNDEKFSLSSLPQDNLLWQIIEKKRTTNLMYWNSKRIPIMSGTKSDQQIFVDFQTLRKKRWNDILIMDTNKKRIILWDFSSLDSGVNQYFPEMMDVPTTKISAIDCLRDEDNFLHSYEQKILKSGYYKVGENDSSFYSVFKQMLRMGSGSHPIANFPSLVAQYIVMESYYNTIKLNNGIENDNFIILDPCSGFSGRMVGVLCSFHKLRRDYQRRFGRKLHVTYLTTDPNKDVHERFAAIVNDWFSLVEPKNSLDYFHFHKQTLGCETPEFLSYCKGVLSDLNVSGVNVALTSPPYFDQEQYSKHPTQCCVKYRNDYPNWVQTFLSGMIKNVYELLQPKGRFYLNIANTKKGSKLLPSETESVRILKEHGMKEVVIYKMLLSGKPPKGCVNVVSVKNMTTKKITLKKFEPVFVYEK